MKLWKYSTYVLFVFYCTSIAFFVLRFWGCARISSAAAAYMRLRCTSSDGTHDSKRGHYERERNTYFEYMIYIYSTATVTHTSVYVPQNQNSQARVYKVYTLLKKRCEFRSGNHTICPPDVVSNFDSTLQQYKISPTILLDHGPLRIPKSSPY